MEVVCIVSSAVDRCRRALQSLNYVFVSWRIMILFVILERVIRIDVACSLMNVSRNTRIEIVYSLRSSFDFDQMIVTFSRASC